MSDTFNQKDIKVLVHTIVSTHTHKKNGESFSENYY